MCILLVLSARVLVLVCIVMHGSKNVELFVYKNSVNSPTRNICCWILPYAELFPVDYPCASLHEPNLGATEQIPPALSVSSAVGLPVCSCVYLLLCWQRAGLDQPRRQMGLASRRLDRTIVAFDTKTSGECLEDWFVLECMCVCVCVRKCHCWV